MKLSRKKRILLLYLGGAAEPFANGKSCLSWFSDFTELRMVADIDVKVVSVVKGDRPTIGHLQRTLRTMDRSWTRYDGFVVVLPYERYLFRSNVLSYMLGGSVQKPVLWATSLRFRDFQDRGDMVDVQLMTNILNATVAAISGVAASAVIGGYDLFPAAHAQLDVVEKKDVLTSLDGATLGHLNFGVQLATDLPQGDGSRPDVALDIDEGVEYFDLSDAATAEDETARLRAFTGSATIVDGGEHLDLGVVRAVPDDMPALFVSKGMAMVRSGSTMTDITHLTPESAAAKFLWMFGKQNGSIIDAMHRNVMGESLTGARV